MASSFHWTCPYCQRDTTINGDRTSSMTHYVDKDSKIGPFGITTTAIVCPNPKCKEIELKASIHNARKAANGSYYVHNFVQSWPLRPISSAKPMPDYVPAGIRADYEEACSIKGLSPKASATLSRRCLQGILRDYWEVKPGHLIDEINQIKEFTHHLTWEAIDSVRQIGNIGAHMERDINVIIDVDPNEAELLINLIEILIRDWYVMRHEREQTLNNLKLVAEAKKQAKSPEQAK